MPKRSVVMLRLVYFNNRRNLDVTSAVDGEQIGFPLRPPRTQCAAVIPKTFPGSDLRCRNPPKLPASSRLPVTLLDILFKLWKAYLPSRPTEHGWRSSCCWFLTGSSDHRVS